MKHIAPIAVVAVLAVASPAHAVFLTWSGSGVEGFDPFGHRWTVGLGFDSGGAQDFPGWGLPGVGNGEIPFLPVDEFVTDFHVTFTNLPQGVSINQDPVETEFVDFDDGVAWSAMFMDNDTVWFFAPPGERLETGEEFYVNVLFDGLPSGGFTDTTVFPNGIEFNAEWTMDGVVPEPSTLAVWTLLALAFGGLSWRRFNR